MKPLFKFIQFFIEISIIIFRICKINSRHLKIVHKISHSFKIISGTLGNSEISRIEHPKNSSLLFNSQMITDNPLTTCGAIKFIAVIHFSVDRMSSRSGKERNEFQNTSLLVYAPLKIQKLNANPILIPCNLSHSSLSHVAR